MLLAIRPSVHDTHVVLLVSAVLGAVLLTTSVWQLVTGAAKFARDHGTQTEARTLYTFAMNLAFSLFCLLLALPLLSALRSSHCRRLSRLWLVWRCGNILFGLANLAFLAASLALDSSAYVYGSTPFSFMPNDFYRLPEERAYFAATGVVCIVCACFPTRSIRMRIALLFLRLPSRSSRASPIGGAGGTTTWLEISTLRLAERGALDGTKVDPGNEVRATIPCNRPSLDPFVTSSSYSSAPAPPVDWDECPSGLSQEVTLAKDAPILGVGGFGCVYAGEWRGLRVAVKQLQILAPDNLRRFRREADLMTALEGHRHICACIGSCLLKGKPAIILELHEGGTLERALAIGAARYEASVCAEYSLTTTIHQPSDEDPSMRPLRSVAAPLRRFDARWQLGVQLASGLAHLHHHQIFHRDIKPSNILLDGTMRHAVLCDFGISRRMDVAATTSDSQSGTWRYMAPEALWVQYRPAADVYSFALLLWSLAYAKECFSEYDGLQVIVLLQGDPHMYTLRPPLSPPPDVDADPEAPHAAAVAANIWEGIKTKLQDCWHGDAARRPVMNDVAEWLTALDIGAA